MSLVDPYSQSQRHLSRTAAARYAALSAIADSKAGEQSRVVRGRVSVWRRVRALVVKPA